MFIQTEETPNPATMKFLPGRTLLIEGSLDIGSAEEAAASPLAQALFGIEGVRGVFLCQDFIAVTKTDSKSWMALKPPVLTAIMEHFAANRPVLTEGNGTRISAGQEGEDPIVTRIRDLLDHRIRPAVAQDGGDIVFQSYEDGIVYVSLRGACAGCPSSTMTLKAGVENLLRHAIPEVREVRQTR